MKRTETKMSLWKLLFWCDEAQGQGVDNEQEKLSCGRMDITQDFLECAEVLMTHDLHQHKLAPADILKLCYIGTTLS